MDTFNLIDRHGRSGMSLTVILLALVCLAAACGSDRSAATTSASTPPAPTTATSAPTAPRPTATFDQLVDVGSGRMHLRCSGTGDQTVVLISGFTGDGESWPKVEPALATRTRVCTHDRFGTGSSDLPPSTQTFATQARALRALLEAAGEPGPFVLVGHSFGGPEAVVFASMYPADVDGLLLLDASPSSWSDVVCRVPDDGTPGAAGFRQACGMLRSPAGNVEHLDGPAAFAEAAAVRTLGDVPLVVATAPTRGAGTDGLPEEVVRTVEDAWHAGQDEWVSLSTAGRLVVVPDTGHYIQDDQPEVVIEQIEGLLR